ncbi:MAG: ABC transporter ATP-binding protein/permease [Tissierellales bacterium]|jgi:ATP-binding cassette subfamily B protein|nr:ABC transporter ATP-binding protein/permease [Tissierellales bacterium]
MTTIKKISVFLKRNKLRYLLAMGAVALATLFSMINPLIIRTTIDSILLDKPLESGIITDVINYIGGIDFLYDNLWIIGFIIIFFTAIRGFFMYYKGKLAAQASEDSARQMREALYDHLQRLPYDNHVKAETGDLIQRCTSDVETIRKFLATQFVTIGQAVFMLICSIAIMLSLNVKLTLVAMSIVPFIFLFSFIFFVKVKEFFSKSDEAEGKLSTTLQENITGVRVVRAFAKEELEIDKFDEKNKNFTDLTYKLIKLLAIYWSSSDFLCLTQAAIVLVYGSYLTYIGEITLGTLSVFITYENMLLWPVRQMGRILADMGKATVSLGRIHDILEIPAEDFETGKKDVNVNGNITFDNVCFSYDDDSDVLNNISFKIKAGQTLAILGSTGSGKSSLVHLLTRLYDYKSGSIKIDGVELNSFNKPFIRKQIGLVLQEPFLYAKTLSENIKIARPNATEEEIIAAAQIACVHDVIEGFDKSYDTLVGEKGVSLSGGQKQRVAIARTILTNCPILIFDDSLSAVDTETDLNIRTALQSVNRNATKIIISHRVSSLSEADLILVLENGKIMESGNHEELIANKGIYHRIHNLQNNLDDELPLSV